MTDEAKVPRTEAGKALYDDVRIHNVAQRVKADDRHDEQWLKRILAIEDEAAGLHPDAGNKARNHYDWFMPENPTAFADDYLDDFEAKMREALTDPFVHDMAQVVLPLIAAYRTVLAGEPSAVLANDLYIRVVKPELTWWDDLPPEMQQGWLDAARLVLDIAERAQREERERWRDALEQTTEALAVARGMDATKVEPDPFAYDKRPIMYHGTNGHGQGIECVDCDYNAAFDALIETNRALLATTDEATGR